MTEQTDRKLNRLEKSLPEGLLVDAAWLQRQGYSTSLRSQYVAAGWLEQPARRVYRRPRGALTWQQVVISLQTILLDDPFIVGGRTALELQGYAHFLPQKTKEVHLYGPRPLPTWLDKLPLDVRFVHHNSRKLFKNDPITYGISSLKVNVLSNTSTSNDPLQRGLTYQPWGQWDWPLTLSTPERAILELLDELPDHESFHQVDSLTEGLSNLSPRRLQKLLADCQSVKVKRLFFFFADRHKHAWLKQIKKKEIDLGSGNRMLVKGGKLDRTYQITVPEDLGAV
jgi:hypothetical protein